MNAVVERDPMSMMFKVWVYQRTHDGILVLRLRDRLAHDWEKVAQGMEAGPPTLTLPEDALRAIVAESSDYLPPSAATDRHLLDALAVRDKALGMVERIIDSDLAREASSRPSTKDAP